MFLWVGLSSLSCLFPEHKSERLSFHVRIEYGLCFGCIAEAGVTQEYGFVVSFSYFNTGSSSLSGMSIIPFCYQ